MKDYLRQSVWWNEFPKNPTQTAYLRFMKTPKAEMPDPFRDVFPDIFKGNMRTIYTDMMGVTDA